MGFEIETKNTSTVISECESKPHAYISSAQNGICNGQLHLFSISDLRVPNQSIGNVAECHFNDSAVSSLDQCPNDFLPPFERFSDGLGAIDNPSKPAHLSLAEHFPSGQFPCSSLGFPLFLERKPHGYLLPFVRYPPSFLLCPYAFSFPCNLHGLILGAPIFKLLTADSLARGSSCGSDHVQPLSGVIGTATAAMRAF
jgi:hypothetical protein